MVDPSLETLAADRGITICFVELDGADGLWLPDERTIMIDNRLSDRRVTEVLEHELSHVDIEDGHAALDAHVGRRAGRARFAAVSAAAASLLVLVAIRMPFAEHPVSDVRQGPPAVGRTTTPPLAGHGHSSVPLPPAITVVTQVFNGEVHTETVTVTPSMVTPTATPAKSAASNITPVGPTRPAGPIATTTSPAPAPTTTTGAPPPATSDTATPTGTPASAPAATSVQKPRNR